MIPRFLKPLRHKLSDILRQSFAAWLLMLKLTIPALILMRLIMWFDLLPQAALAFQPFMSLVGLPPEAALVWAAAMLTNVYTGLAVFMAVLPAMGPLSVCQATVLSSMILIAHNLLMEGQVCRGAGVSPLRVTVFRMASALLYGLMLHQFGRLTGWGAGLAAPLLNFTSDPTPPWGLWFLGSLRSLALILAVIVTLMIVMAVFKRLGITALALKLLGPPLKLAGIGESALLITVIGNVLGLAYGGGLIIAESRSGRIAPADIYGSVTFMAICHSLLEDSLLISTLDSSAWGNVAGRLLFALALTALVTRLARRPWGRTLLVGRGYAARP